jgi:hypothetical protein
MRKVAAASSAQRMSGHIVTLINEIKPAAVNVHIYLEIQLIMQSVKIIDQVTNLRFRSYFCTRIIKRRNFNSRL